MKVSGSVLCSAIAAAYAVIHLAFLAPSLEDIDSINFALGLHEFDVARHQPHPPGYPLYIALGRASLAVIGVVAPGLDALRTEALALAIWSALGGALALVAAFMVFRAVADIDGASRPMSGHPTGTTAPGAADRAAVWATTLLAVAPLFWMSGLRPMSDMPGLALVLVAQALLLSSWKTPHLFAAGAFVAGLAVGMRVQAIWLTAPLLVLMVYRHRQARVAWLLTRPLAALVAGGLVWAIPLLAAAGGVNAYMRALGSQAGEDFAWVDMVAANPTPRRLAFALYETVVMPWGTTPMAVVALAAAGVGLLVLARRAPAALALVTLAFAPYAAFHLLFQETLHVRYALPLMPPLAWLAVQGLAATGRVAPVAVTAVCLFAAWTALPGMRAYASEPHPAFRAARDMAALAGQERPAAVYSHYSVRRSLQIHPPAGVKVVEPPRTNEWSDLVAYWRNGGAAPVWFLADPRRTDLAIVDPQARRDVRHYRWAAGGRPELNGTRPPGVDWYLLHAPGWFAGEGWSLTPELGGMTRLAGNGVDRRPIDAMVRRRPDAMTVVVGARHLGAPADGAVSLSLLIDGRTVDEWTLDPTTDLNVLRVVQLAGGALDGDGRYARLTISARAATGMPTPPVAIRQFDIQPATGLIYAFDQGWHEEEYDNASGLRWRWSSGRSILRVLPPQAVTIRLRGESPLKYIDEPPTVRVLAGDRTVAERRLVDDFDWTITVSDDDARRADGHIAIETTPVYLPGRAEGTADERQLGLRLFDVAVIPSRPD